MLARPFKSLFRIARIRASRLNNQSLYNDRDSLIFAGNYMKMRRIVIVKIHLNSAAVEPDDRRHERYSSAHIALTQ